MKKVSFLLLVVALTMPTFVNAAPPASSQPASPDPASLFLSPTNQTSEPDSLRVIEASADGVSLALSTPAYQISQVETADGNFMQPVVQGYGTTQTPGLPVLPLQSGLIAVPPGAQLRVEIVAAPGERLPGSFDLLPAPQVQVQNETLATLDKASGLPDLPAGTVNVYERANPASVAGGVYPASVAEVGDTAVWRGQRVAAVRIFPFQADLNSGALTFFKDVRITVHFDYAAGGRPPADAAPAAEDPYFEALFRDNLLNYESARAWRQISDTSAASEPLAPQTGQFKIVVDTDGLYRITYADLVNAGFNAAGINPQQFALSNQGSPVAMYVNGESDGRFDPGDYVEFYGQAQRSVYTQNNVYWLSVSGPAGPRMTVRDVTPGSAPVPGTFRDTYHAEEDMYRWTQHLQDNRAWWWQKVTLYDYPGLVQVTATLPIDVPDVGPQSQPVAIRVAMASNTNYNNYPDHHVQISLNDPSAATYFSQQIWDGRTPIEVAGTVDGSALRNGANSITLHAIFDMGTPVAFDIYYVDWVEFTYDRLFAAHNNEARFSKESPGTWRFEVNGFTSAAQVYDVSNPLRPVRLLNSQMSGSQLRLQDTSSPATRYYAVGSAALRSARRIERYTAPPLDLTNTQQRADYLIITHPQFMDAVQPLAQFRASQGMQVQVINVVWLYDQFNYGIVDPQAIKNFISYAYHNWAPPAPGFVVLVGDSTFNPLGHNPDYYGPVETSFVPSFLSNVDPYTGEVADDNQFVTVDGNDSLADLYLGRFPAQTVAEVQAMIDKTINYERTVPAGAWRGRLLFATDNYRSASGAPDPAGNFEAVAENVINDWVPPWYEIRRAYYDPYPNDDNGEAWRYRTVDAERQGIAGEWNNGAAIVNYIGHASINMWGEELFRRDDVALLHNSGQYPVALSLDCLDGYFDWPNNPSLAETLIEAVNSGTVANWAPTGLGVATGHDVLHKGFYQAVNGNGVRILSQATQTGKLELYAQGHNLDLIQTFMIFGDPALHLALPASPQELALTLAATPGDVVGLGSTITYQIDYANTGSTAATQVVLNLPLPSNLLNASFSATGPTAVARPGTSYTWDIASIPAGAAGRITVQAQVSTATTAAQIPIVANASLRNRWTEPNISNNYATVSVDVLQADSFEPDDTQAQAKPLTLGVAARHTLHANSDVDWVWFDAQAGQRYFAYTGNLSANGDTVLKLYNAAGTLLVSNQDFMPGVRWSGITWTAPATGRYYLQVSAQGTPGPFAYSIFLEWQHQLFLPFARH